LDPVLIALLSVHLLLALGWLGGELMTAFVIGPGVRQMSFQSRREFTAKVIPRAVRYVEWMIVGTGVTGVLLAPLTPSKIAANTIVVLAGIVLSLMAAAVEVLVTRPAFKRMVTLEDALQKGEQQTPHPEMDRQEKRARLGTLSGSALLVVVLVLMVISGL
jgi:uncharacterized membrane protein